MSEESAQAAYEAYRDASGGKSLVSGQGLPQWHEQAPEIREAWRAAAFAAIACAGVTEPAQAATVIVKTDTGAEIRFAAGEFDADGQLDIRDTGRKANAGIVASYAPGRWNSVRLDGVTEPDTARRQLMIAKEALALIARSNPGDPRKVAHDALDDIWAEDE